LINCAAVVVGPRLRWPLAIKAAIVITADSVLIVAAFLAARVTHWPEYDDAIYLVLFVATLSTAAAAYQHRLTLKDELCECGYDTSGLNRCPECGRGVKV
jgi:peptidoglycan/LPS O-acetylase OafA/YrhL